MSRIKKLTTLLVLVVVIFGLAFYALRWSQKTSVNERERNGQYDRGEGNPFDGKVTFSSELGNKNSQSFDYTVYEDGLTHLFTLHMDVPKSASIVNQVKDDLNLNLQIKMIQLGSFNIFPALFEMSHVSEPEELEKCNNPKKFEYSDKEWANLGDYTAIRNSGQKKINGTTFNTFRQEGGAMSTANFTEYYYTLFGDACLKIKIYGALSLLEKTMDSMVQSIVIKDEGELKVYEQ